MLGSKTQTLVREQPGVATYIKMLVSSRRTARGQVGHGLNQRKPSKQLLFRSSNFVLQGSVLMVKKQVMV